MFTISHIALRSFVGAVGTILCAGACLAGAAAPAAAAETTRVQHVVISDLNLGSTTDRQRFDVRVDAAARAVCSTDVNDMAAIVDAARCRTNARTGANAQLKAKTSFAAR